MPHYTHKTRKHVRKCALYDDSGVEKQVNALQVPLLFSPYCM